jgi:hypothetical protein
MDLQRRIEQLEAQQRMMFAEMASGIGKRGRFAAPLQMRLAKTVEAYGESYPTSGNVFPIKFVDCNFDPENGATDPTYSERRATKQQEFVLAIYGDTIPIDTVIPVFHIPSLKGTSEGEWFTDWQDASGGERDYGRVKVKNCTTTSMGATRAVRLGDPLIDPTGEAFRSEPYFEGWSISPSYLFGQVTIAEGDAMFDDDRRFGVLVQDLAPGESGYAVVSGVCVASVYINSPQHTRCHASPRNGFGILESSYEGEAVIIWQPPSKAGNQQCVINLSGPPKLKRGYLRGKFQHLCEYSATASANTFDGNYAVVHFTGLTSPYNVWGGYISSSTFAGVDKDGTENSDGPYFKATADGEYFFNLTLNVKYPEIASSVTRPDQSVGVTATWLRYYKCIGEVAIFRKRDGIYSKRALFLFHRYGQQELIAIDVDGSGNVTAAYHRFDEGNFYDILSTSGIISIKKDDVIFVAIKGELISLEKTDTTTGGITGSYSLGSGDKWYMFGDLSLVQVPIGTESGGDGFPYATSQWDKTTEKDGSGTGGVTQYRLQVAAGELWSFGEEVTITVGGSSVKSQLTLFNSFREAEAEKVHNLGSDTLKWMLTNSAPVLTNTVKSNITEISAGSGYTAGGTAATISASSQTDGKYTLKLADVTFTASGGTIGPARYAVLYNDTASNDELIGWVDYGSSVTVADGGTFVIDCDATVGVITKG